MSIVAHVQPTLYLFIALVLLWPNQSISAPDIVIGKDYKLIRTKPWPADTRRKIGIERYETEIDKEPAVRIVFNCSKTYMLLTFHGQWKKLTKHSLRYSCQLVDSDNHNLKFSISEFHNGEFLQNLEEEEWAGYKKYLDRRFPKTITYYEEEGTGLNREINVFNQYYRQIAYTYKSSKNVLTRAREIFVFLDEVLYVITFSGPAESFDKEWNQQSFYLSRLRLSEKNVKNAKSVKESPVIIR